MQSVCAGSVKTSISSLSSKFHIETPRPTILPPYRNVQNPKEAYFPETWAALRGENLFPALFFFWPLFVYPFEMPPVKIHSFYGNEPTEACTSSEQSENIGACFAGWRRRKETSAKVRPCKNFSRASFTKRTAKQIPAAKYRSFLRYFKRMESISELGFLKAYTGKAVLCGHDLAHPF